MSAQATGHVWKCAPFGGSKFLILLGIADVVNSDFHNCFWMTSTNLGNKVRMHPTNVRRHLKELVEDGWLEVLEPGGGNGKATKFRFHPLETKAPLTYAPKQSTASQRLAPEDKNRITAHGGYSEDMRLTASQHSAITKENLKELKAEPDSHVEKNDDSSNTHNAPNLPSKNVRSGKHNPDTINNNLEGIRAIRKATRTDPPNETNTDSNK